MNYIALAAALLLIGGWIYEVKAFPVKIPLQVDRFAIQSAAQPPDVATASMPKVTYDSATQTLTMNVQVANQGEAPAQVKARTERSSQVKDEHFVFDGHTGYWDASAENCKNRFGEAFIETFYAFHNGFNPPDPRWTMDYEGQFRKVDPDWYLEEMFVKGQADMTVLSTQVLMDFYHTGFVNPARNAQLAARAPERIIPLGGVDPRAPDALDQVERQITDLGMRGFKWYTAEWRGDSRGWNANDPMVFPLYEKCLELGVKNMFFHKGPAVEPLSLSKFDVRDIDEPAWLYPDLNFIIDHCGAPRVDDFCWLATRCPNVYAGLAVVLALIHNRPRWFAEVMANLLYWLGPDRIVYGTDFPIWYPHWQLEDFMAFELPEDLKQEYGVDLTPEMKQKIIGGNLARLYGIDVEQKLKAIEGDELSQRRAEYLANLPAMDTGVAGTTP